jgi:hypothetical protein
LIKKQTPALWSQIRAAPLAKKTASLIGKETDESRTSNIERSTFKLWTASARRIFTQDMGYKVKPLAAEQAQAA